MELKVRELPVMLIIGAVPNTKNCAAPPAVVLELVTDEVPAVPKIEE